MNTLIAKDVFRLPEMNARLLSTSALLLALDVILYKIAIGPAYFQITFGFLSMALMGYLYGPIWAGLLEMLSNTLNFTIFGSGTFQAAFLITAFLGGFINGLFLYHIICQIKRDKTFHLRNSKKLLMVFGNLVIF
ncbi:ECF transporter S component [Enterococcus faecium]|uniref:ECF transporter S component n=3 Tax=Enterococcus faecium TaxID=1352 RepID=UPI000FFF5320|nr:ECF transporter S component [Enterococcus faecium]